LGSLSSFPSGDATSHTYTFPLRDVFGAQIANSLKECLRALAFSSMVARSLLVALCRPTHFDRELTWSFFLAAGLAVGSFEHCILTAQSLRVRNE
jgi:hypothetical protein